MQGDKLAQDSSCNRNPGPSQVISNIEWDCQCLSDAQFGFGWCSALRCVICREVTANQCRRFQLPEISSVCKHLVYFSFKSDFKRIKDVLRRVMT